MANPYKLLRRVIQCAFLLLFLGLFWQARWHGPGLSAPPPLFLRMDPLSALCVWLAPTPTWPVLLIPALLLLLLTALLGRFFCGWICPLGTTIDIFDHLFLRKTRRSHEHLNRPALKFHILGLTLLAALFGTQLAWLLDPIPLLTRTLAVVFYPLAVGLYNAGVIASRPALGGLGVRLDPTDTAPTFALNLLVLLVFAAVLATSFLSRRYYCRTLCPLGALLGFLGRFGLLRRHVTGCVSCGRCVRECKMGAVLPPDDCAEDYHRTHTAECILCYDCLACPRPGITHIGLHPGTQGADPGLRLSKRHFLASLGLGALYGATASTGAGRRATSGRLIRPPGAILRTPAGIRPMREEQFRDLCVRCGNCMKACVTGGLQPAVVEAGFDGVFTPILVPKLGYCEQGCTACGEVCPTGALARFTVEEKAHIKLGLAAVHKDKCLSWQTGHRYRLCLVCNEHCPYGAVAVIDDDGRQRPVVNAGVCVGCGQCEKSCPVRPEAAIVVYRSASRV